MIETFVVDGVHSFLCNFYEDQFLLPWGTSEEISWAMSAEHAYQSMKATSDDDALYVLSALSPGEAKKRGRAIFKRNDWEEVKLGAMRAVLNLKFEKGTPLAARLLQTGDEYLQEGNTWGDRFWGVDGTGENWLGHLLMARRAELRSMIY